MIVFLFTKPVMKFFSTVILTPSLLSYWDPNIRFSNNFWEQVLICINLIYCTVRLLCIYQTVEHYQRASRLYLPLPHQTPTIFGPNLAEVTLYSASPTPSQSIFSACACCLRWLKSKHLKYLFRDICTLGCICFKKFYLSRASQFNHWPAIASRIEVAN